MAPQPIALVLGAGPRIGASVAAAFQSKGYSVATASRSGTGAKTSEGYLSLAADFGNPSSIAALFDSVKATFGAAPSVVVYNAASLTPPPDSDSVLSISAESFVNDLNINTVSPYVAAQRAVEEWATLPGDVKKTFIYTGNPLNVNIMPVPLYLDLGVGKRASTYWIAVADATYAAKGYRFHYADERAQGGKGKGGPNLDGPAHGEFYAQLASHEGDIPWNATFVAGEGYGKFD
ncbi:hypothetical protein BJY00DRAFT_30546 [Aspergillus carlsbadensis]|nr:hypothetical protein BJY00DRAFT_30546 [Aspergillus carlsbadensis]